MRVTHIIADRREEWDAFVAREPSFALLQSWEWGEFKEKFGWKAFRIAVEEQGQIVAGAQILIKSLPLGLTSIAYVPRGPIGDWLYEEIPTHLLSELHRVARGHKAAFLKIEPPLLNNPVIGQTLQRHHFRASSYANQPRATIIVDLTRELDDILAQMHTKTRYNIRYAVRKGITVRLGDRKDLSTLDYLMQIVGRRSGFTPRRLEYYEREWEMLAPLEHIRLFVASYQGKTLAVNVSAVFGEHAAYLHGASSNEHRNLMPNHLLMWEAIKWAKSRGCHTFDLWGIPEEVGLAEYEGDDLPVSSHTDGLWGVYRFKRGFSKNVILYMSAHDHVYSPLLYALVTNKLLNADMLDRIAVWMDSLRYT